MRCGVRGVVCLVCVPCGAVRCAWRGVLVCVCLCASRCARASRCWCARVGGCACVCVCVRVRDRVRVRGFRGLLVGRDTSFCPALSAPSPLLPTPSPWARNDVISSPVTSLCRPSLTLPPSLHHLPPPLSSPSAVPPTVSVLVLPAHQLVKHRQPAMSKMPDCAVCGQRIWNVKMWSCKVRGGYVGVTWGLRGGPGGWVGRRQGKGAVGN